MCSIDSGPIFGRSLGQKLSIDGLLVSILFPQRISSRRKGSGHDPEIRGLHEFPYFRRLECING